MSKNGGPAFPHEPFHNPSYAERGDVYGSRGMSLRDYFAIHCDQPGEAEIATAAGFTLESGRVWYTTTDGGLTFNDWWRTLTQEQRFELYAKVRYEMADAMLKARDA